MYISILNYSMNSIQGLIFIAIGIKLHLGQLQCTSQDDIFDNVSREDNYWHLHSHHSEPKNNTTEWTVILQQWVSQSLPVYICILLIQAPFVEKKADKHCN